MDLELHSVTLNDANYLYGLLKARPSYSNIHHKALPTFDFHQDFIESDPYKEWHIIKACPGPSVRSPVGACYITHNNEIGIQIDPDNQGKGYAKKAFELLMHHKTGKFLAHISVVNYKSKQFFHKMGFRPISETYELEVK